ncbi:ATPase AAA [Nitzschia inconspicua]|uniref:ATP-dependent DNA helicase n=1 Tax=Nitzschia inconspicua TaxID=303405 RepID=A0A9K3L702_9STRA|nr:ATPase AAA [Nitzschia inconspicua]
MAKTKINYSNVKNALLWLKEHNRLYKDIDTETFVSVTPHVVDESEAVMSVYNNIEEVYEVFAIFLDKNLPCSTNGGCENSGELKDLTIERLLLSGGSKDATLICRPTKNILRDYQGNNLLLASPVQFPYGIGCKDSKGDYRAGYPYLKHLCSLSHPNFHRANWCRLLMEMKLVHEMLPPRRILSAKVIERMRYTPSSEIKFTVAALQNVHSSEHRKSCFKKGCECRMKIPSPNTTKTLVLFDDVQTKWYDWRGNDISRALSICVPKRAHVNAFVNVNNAFVSTLFGCNTNVATGLDGGSVMYCTCYISKNTEKEDSEHFASAAKHMVKRMEQRMMERMVTDNEEQEEEDSSIGLKSMIGAALMATIDHKVAAPMASYLIRNGSRFHYSHFFAYVNIGSFFKDVHEDFNISADGDGKVFLKSSVANYIYRPMELEGVCVYDFLAKYSACGTGKSHVIKTACQYAQKLCKALGVKFDKRTIVVTALTGAAAVSINGETTAGAFAFKRKVKDELEEFKNTYLVIVDEVFFASVEDMELLNEKMKQIFDNSWEPFGGVPIVFSGDFAQLSPVGGRPLYKSEHSIVWKEYLNAFMELRTNHRFDKDVNWGAMLGRFRDVGLSTKEVAIINTRVVGAQSGPRERNIPFDAVYATKTNVDRMAINDAISAKHLENTHSTDPGIQPPMHTLCIKAGNLRFHVRGTRREYSNMKRKAQDIIYAAVGEAHVEDQCNKRHDPLLKLYYGRPLYINHNEDVAGCVANGAICEFRGVKLKPAVSQKDFETIIIDGYHVNCVSITQVDSLLVNMLDGCKGGNKETIIELSPKVIYASAKFPVPFTGPITKNSMRTRRRISFEQFPVNCANARTVHKLQGRSIHHLVVSAWDYTDNWVYVCLSRCTTMNGLFLHEPLNPSITKGMAEEVRAFIKCLRKIKKRAHVFLHGEDL